MKITVFIVMIVFISILAGMSMRGGLNKGMVMAVLVANVIAVYVQLSMHMPEVRRLAQVGSDWFTGPDGVLTGLGLCDENEANDANDGSGAPDLTKPMDVSASAIAAAEHVLGIENATDKEEEMATAAPREAAIMPFYGEQDELVEDAPPEFNHTKDLYVQMQYNGGYARTAKRIEDALALSDPARGYVSTDDRIAELNAMRNREKDAQIGASTKTSDYIRYQMGEEFDIEEDRDWTGRHEQ